MAAGSGGLFHPRVLSRTEGPASGPAITFAVPHLTGVTFAAVALDDGTIIVQQVQCFQRRASLLHRPLPPSRRPHALRPGAEACRLSCAHLAHA